MRSMLSPFAGLLLLVALSATAFERSAAQAARGTFLGRVDVGRPAAPEERRPDVAALGTVTAAGDRTDGANRSLTVVYLEAAPTGAFEARQPERGRIDQRNEAFHPRVLAVTAGSRVDFPNNDSTYHNVFSLSRPKRFDLGRYPQGSSRSVVFDRPGIVRVFCDIHSHMSAYVLVFGHPYHAITGADGGYRIDAVPPGTYTLSAWHEGSVRETRTATIPPSGGVVHLDFVVR